jgi:hypothetical protein
LEDGKIKIKILTKSPLFAKQRGAGGEFMRKVDKRFRVECFGFNSPLSPHLPLTHSQRGAGGEFMRKVDKRFRVECSGVKIPPSPNLPLSPSLWSGSKRPQDSAA